MNLLLTNDYFKATTYMETGGICGPIITEDTDSYLQEHHAFFVSFFSAAS